LTEEKSLPEQYPGLKETKGLKMLGRSTPKGATSAGKSARERGDRGVARKPKGENRIEQAHVFSGPKRGTDAEAKSIERIRRIAQRHNNQQTSTKILVSFWQGEGGIPEGEG